MNVAGLGFVFMFDSSNNERAPKKLHTHRMEGDFDCFIIHLLFYFALPRPPPLHESGKSK